MGKFKEPVWLTLSPRDPVVQDCFPHVWGTHRRGDLCDAVAYPDEPVTICMHCFVERCGCTDQQSRCLLPSMHNPDVAHVNDRNHRWRG